MNLTKGTSNKRSNDDTAGSLRNPSLLLLVALILAVYIGLRLWRLTSSCLWFDEIFSIHAASYDWNRLFSFVAADIIHPPLLYVLLKLWVGLGGDSVLWGRLFPALISIAATVPFLLLCRELQLRRQETVLALILLAVNGYLIKYAQEVRMYSPLFFLSLCSLWLFVRFLKSDTKKTLLPLSAVNLLLVYTHYYGWLLVAAQAAALIFRHRAKLLDFVISVAVLLLAFSPWVYAVVSRSEAGNLSQNIGWVARPRLGDLAQFIPLLNEPFYFRQSSHELLFYRWSAIAGFVLLVLPLLVLLWQTFKERKQPGTQSEVVGLLLILFLTPLVLAFVLSWFLPHSIWGTRNLIIIVVPYTLLIAIALNRLGTMWVKTTVLLLLGCWLFVAASAFMIRRPPDYIWCAWEPLGRQLAQQPETENLPVKVYAFEDLIAYHLWFGQRKEEPGQFKVGVIKGIPGLQEDPAYFLPRAFNEITTTDYLRLDDEEIWIAFRDLRWDESRPPVRTLIERGYQIQDVLETTAGGQRAFMVKLSRK